MSPRGSNLAQMTPEQRSANARKGAQAQHAKMTPEQRKERGRRGYAAGIGKLTPEQRSANSRARIAKFGSPFARKGEDNHHWQGDDIGYHAAHQRVRKIRGSASEHACVDCGGQACEWSFDEPHGYSADVSRYSPRCKPCHARYDQVTA